MSDVETVEAPAEPEPHAPCLCGCGGIPKSKPSRFMPGHDAQLKGVLYRVIRDSDTSGEDRAVAVARLDELQWPQPAPKKPRSTKAATNGATEGEPDSGEVTAADL